LDISCESTNKVLFVTGASRGFGAMIVEKALASGHCVVATARNPRMLIERFGDHSRILTVTLDVTDEAQAHAASMAAVERFGRIDVLINNAGCVLHGAVEEASAKEVEVLYRTNLFGLLATTRAVLPYMRRHRSGHIINFSRVEDQVAQIGWGVYYSTMRAVEGISKALAAELQPLGIHVTVVECGYSPAAVIDTRSLASVRTIDDYRDASGSLRGAETGMNRAQRSDPVKLVDGLLQLIVTPDPPLRLPLRNA
jgi:NAD(P)-dependent dehydrogenase (short-subunit alcohol dehydrogenase family)